MELELQDVTAGSLSLARVQRMNGNTVSKFCNTLENVATDYNLCDTPGNVFKIEEIDVHVNKKPGAVITENGSKNVHVLISGGKSENITVIACCNDAGQFLSFLL